MDEQSAIRVLQPSKVRAARARLLIGPAADLADRVRAILCEPTRAQIVRALGAGPLCVTDLAAVVGRSRTVVSQHLRILREDGIVQHRRRGRTAFYGLADDPAADSAARALDAVAEVARS